MPRFVRKGVKPSVITLADRARDQGQWDVAAGYYREALRRNPQNPPIWVQYGHVLKESGHLAEAERAYRTALAYDPRNVDPHLQLGHVLKILGREEEARGAYLRGFALDPSLKGASLEFLQLGWSNAHVSEAQGMVGVDIDVPSPKVNGTLSADSVPISSFSPRSEDDRKIPFGSNIRPRLRARDEDVALIAPYFGKEGVFAQIGENRFEIFGASEYLSNPELWSCAPHYLFSPSWYTGQLTEALDPATNPFLHYLHVGVYEGKSPHPLFDPEYYLVQWERREPSMLIDQLFDHYLQHGRQRDISPHLLFSPSWYRRVHLKDVEEGVDPLNHYLSEGYRHWFSPHILFDEGWYRHHAKDLDHHTPGLVDYIARGAKMDFDPHPLFRSQCLREQGVSLQDPQTPLERYVTGTLTVDPHPLFSTTHYLSQCSAVGELTPLEHYLEEGWRQGFDPHPFFRTDWYLRLSMDVSERMTNPLLHYEKVGRQAGKGPHPFFDPLWYAACHMGNDPTLLPEQHYLSTGLAYDLIGRDRDPLHSGSLLRLTNIPKVPSGRGSRLPTIPSDQRIGVFLHAFYPELSEELFRYLNNIPEPCTVFISTDTAVKAQILRQTAKRCLRHSLEIRVLPNRGRDIAPWLVGFADRMREVEVGLHLHTKKSPHSGSKTGAWRRFLLEGLVGSPEIVETHLNILSSARIGASFVEHFPPLVRGGTINWGHNFELTRDLLLLCDVEISDQTPVEFPSGSMFWFKTRALLPLLELDLRFEFFEPESGAVDGTVAHAIERAFLYIIEAAGYGWVETTTKSHAPIPAGVDPIDLVPFLASGGIRMIPTERRSTALSRLLPTVVPFNTRASAAEKPRFNLVVPEIDLDLGYAGLTNAFELFFGVLKSLGGKWDARVLGIDHDATESYVPPEGFSFVELGEFDWSGRSVVSNATQRAWRLVDLRRSDYFLATAWSTAHIVSLACRDQARLFGTPLKKFIYLIQDYEPPFHPWSSLYHLANATYEDTSRFDAVFNTELLARFCKQTKGIEGYIYSPRLNPQIAQHLSKVNKQKQILVYYRTWALRNCHELCEVIVEELVAKDPGFYADWRFFGIGQGIPETVPGSRIEGLGRLSLEEYGRLIARSAVGLSLMVSPHPSYPPLEMAAGGMLVLTNTYGEKDLSQLHENIVSWHSGCISDAVDQLDRLCRAFDQNAEIGWKGRSKIDWFFTQSDNLNEIARALAKGLSAMK
jgi:hypothetical protein